MPLASFSADGGLLGAINAMVAPSRNRLGLIRRGLGISIFLGMMLKLGNVAATAARPVVLKKLRRSILDCGSGLVGANIS